MAFREIWSQRLTDWHSQRLIQQSLAGEHDHLKDIHRQLLPNFVVIGAAKSATTSLLTALDKHPSILISKHQEPKFFGRHYIRGWEWYAKQFKGGENYRLRGEGSTMYTSSYQSYKHTPELIKHHLGNIPLIYLVRHPLRRIESQWRHWRGRSKCPPFEQLIQSKGLQQRIIEASMYNKQLNRYRRFFPEESILCLTTEELVQNTSKSLKRILRFLGAKPKVKPLLDGGQLPLKNRAGTKGRDDIPMPQWPDQLKKQTIDLIRPDSEAFLKAIGHPIDTWQWD